MSGWDEGAIYYSDQAQSLGGDSGDPGSNAAAATRHSALQKFKEFIRSFETQKNVFSYRESLLHNPKYLLVDIEDLDAFDADLVAKLRNSPADYLPLVTKPNQSQLISPFLFYLFLFRFFNFPFFFLSCDFVV